ncbi:MAG: hypothetical protein WC814_03015 [Candidatus Paceibacterota bacterium]|jgi:hypothetical protein
MAHKGNGYSEDESVANAMKRTGWSAEVLFANAKIFTGVNGFDASAAAAVFEAGKARPPRPVIQLADWVNTKDPKDVHAKFKKLN